MTLSRTGLSLAVFALTLSLALGCGSSEETTVDAGPGATSSGAGGEGGSGSGGSDAGGGGSAPGACGDGEIGGDEACDDQNTAAGDGCGATCAIETGHACDGEPSVCAPVCGDGAVVGAEACDDQNTTAGDGCSDTCAGEPGFVCSGEPSVCVFTCGDGALGANETCDDGNVAIGDGCGPTCSFENGFTCVGEPSVCSAICGDGLQKGAEACDDGNVGSGDGCSVTCTKELGFTCTGQPSLCKAVCGDGQKKGAETCDDSNTLAGDGCSDTCGIEVGFVCNGSPSACQGVCGDGMMVGSETCDDGNALNGDCCTSACQAVPGCEIESNDAIDEAIDFALIAANGAVHGVIAPGDKDIFSFTIPAGTTGSMAAHTGDGAFGATCKDRTIDTWLSLLDANGVWLRVDEDGGEEHCSALAQGALVPGTYYVAVNASPYEPMASFDYSLVLAIGACGDGVVDTGEECDDGTLASGDGCDGQCRYESILETETNDPASGANGPYELPIMFAGNHTSLLDPDWFAFTISTTTDIRIESFDHFGVGNCFAADGSDTYLTLYDTDGVTALATDDDSGIGSCSLIDGSLQAGARRLRPGTYYVEEHVGSSNAFIPNTSYRILIKAAAECGNLQREGFEECDGGPLCTADCDRIPTCGDGFVDGLERCDDGNLVVGDGCGATCQHEGSLLEIEANGTVAEADARANDPFPLLITGDTFLLGAMGSVTDVDMVRVEIATPSVLAIGTYDPSGDECHGGAEVTLAWTDMNGVPLHSDAGGGIRECSSLVVQAAPGTYYVSLTALGIGAATGEYALAVHFLPDVGAESEPNAAQAMATSVAGSLAVVHAGHQTAMDVDYFEVTVPAAGMSLEAEVIEAGGELCESFGIDSLLTLYDATGKLLAQDDDTGRGFCSRIDGRGEDPDHLGASKLAAGTYYLAVTPAWTAQSDADGQFDYALAVGLSEPGCAGCDLVITCVQPGDCQSGVCAAGLCQAPTCTDGFENGSESDIDCGGVICAPCITGQGCAFDTDCAGGVCSQGACQAEPPSCINGTTGAGHDCGPSFDQACCASPLIPGGAFLRSYDAVSYSDASNPATVSPFRLDRYEATVGRFRAFLDAGAGTNVNPPPIGAGSHYMIPGIGWTANDTPNLKATRAGVEGTLVPNASCTWTTSPGANENLPINCIDWYQAFAFCAWDGGRLPTEAEWGFAALGGSEQRSYAWSVPANSQTITAAHAVYNGVPAVLPVGSTSPTGDAKWGQADLTGNVWEWAWDWDGVMPNPCVDCVNTTPALKKSQHGGSFQWSAALNLSSRRGSDPPSTTHLERGGVRCARNP